MEKIGFLFGAGAEISYGMPSGGKFALDIFRQNPTKSKEELQKMRDKIDKGTAYATNWLPKNFEENSIHVFGDRVFDNLIRDTVGNNRKKIIERINEFDKVAKASVSVIEQKFELESLDKKIEMDLNKKRKNININHKLGYSEYFESGDGLFENNYFAVLIEYYQSNVLSGSENKELGEMIRAIFQLQLGAMSEDLSRQIEDNIFKKNELKLDIFEDLGGSLSVNYETAGIDGLKLLATDRTEKLKGHPIIDFAFEIIERIYAEVLDYKSLIDLNWHYLYNPQTEWAKFCRISTFLYTVQKYIEDQSKLLNSTVIGYYDDLRESDMNISVVATTNYNSFIEKKTDEEVIFLNGGIEEYYDPYVNSVGSKEDLNKNEKHFIVPLLFTQSGTKPMTSIDMLIKYVDFYEKLKNSDAICSVGFGFNFDDEHINGIIRMLIDRDDKKLFIVDILEEEEESVKRENLEKKLKVSNSENINFITVNKVSRKVKDKNKIWTEVLKEALN